MVIGTALGWGDFATIVLAVTLAFFVGYSLTMLPLLRVGLALGAALPLAFASDTLSITVMETVDNAIVLVIAGAIAFPVNRWLIARGKGHAVVHEYYQN